MRFRLMLDAGTRAEVCRGHALHTDPQTRSGTTVHWIAIRRGQNLAPSPDNCCPRYRGSRRASSICGPRAPPAPRGPLAPIDEPPYMRRLAVDMMLHVDARERWPGHDRVIARIVGSSVIAVTAVAAGRRLMTTEPLSRDAGLQMLVGFGLLGLTALVVAIAIAVAARTRRLAVVVVLAFVAGVVAVCSTEALHWRWSRADFAAVHRGGDLPCDEWKECRLGWWRVSGVDRSGEMVFVWLVADTWCYAGLGLAKPLNGDMDELAIASAARSAGPTGNVGVERWRDGWYELCFIT